MSGFPEDGRDRPESVIATDDGVSSGRALTRRQVLQAGAGAVAVAALEAAPASAHSWSGPQRGPRFESLFDEGWRFHRGDATRADAAAFDDRDWRQLELPHDWRIEDLPYATSDDGGATADPSGFAFRTSPAADGTAPAVIGPFDRNADPTPDGEVDFFGQHLVMPGGRYQGYTVGDVGWYRKHFRTPRGHQERHGHRVELRFDGVYGRTDVWLNGAHLGFHANGYTSYAYDLTPHLNRHGDNVLAVRVDNRGKTSRWYTGSGIYRHTWLTITGSVRIPLWGVRVTTPTVDERRSVTRVEVQAANFGTPTDARVRMTVLDPHGRPVASQTTAEQTLKTGATQTYAAELAIHGAALWSPEEPNLYRLQTELMAHGRVVDGTTTTFGIRSVAWNGTDGLVLNGKPIKLRGGSAHHDHGPLGAIALARADERRIETLKAGGFNALRTSHNPPSPSLLEACDRLGMLVWDEFSDVWDVAKTKDDYSNYFAANWQQDLTSMILRDRNHPSVIIWSLGNEIPADPNNYGPRMRALVESLDTTRAITVGGTPFANAYSDVPDVHYGDLTAYLTGQPVPSSVLSTHASDPTKAVTQSESFPASIYADFKLAQANAWMAGSFVWTAWDYIGETGVGAPPYGATAQDAALQVLRNVLGQVPYPWFNAFSGDFDLIGQRKPQNHWRAVVYGLSAIEMMVERPAPAGTQQYASLWGYYDELESWTWDVPEDRPLTVHVYTPGDTVVLLLNGRQIATKALSQSDQMIATFTVPYAPGTLTAIATRGGRRIGQKTLETVGAPAAVRLTSDARSLTTGRDDLAHVLVEVVDAHGRRVPDAVAKVEFAVGGAGTLAGVGNGNPHNVDSFQQPRHWTWHGQALAILRPAETPGRLTITAAADGMQPATLALPVTRRLDVRPTQREVARLAARAGIPAGPGLLFGLAAAVLGRRMRATGDYRVGGDER